MRLSLFYAVAAALLAPFAFADDSDSDSSRHGEELEFVKFYSPPAKAHFRSGENIIFDYRVYAHPDDKGEATELKISLYDKWVKKYYVITTAAPVDVDDTEKYHDYHYQWLIHSDYDWKGEFQLIITEKYEKEHHWGEKTIYYPIYVDSDDGGSDHDDDDRHYSYNSTYSGHDDHDDSDDYHRHSDHDDDDHDRDHHDDDDHRYHEHDDHDDSDDRSHRDHDDHDDHDDYDDHRHHDYDHSHDHDHHHDDDDHHDSDSGDHRYDTSTTTNSTS